jgi:hypothetical protein
MREAIKPISFQLLILLGYALVFACLENLLFPGTSLFSTGILNGIIVHGAVCLGIAIYHFVKRRPVLGYAHLACIVVVFLLGITLVKDFGPFIS